MMIELMDESGDFHKTDMIKNNHQRLVKRAVGKKAYGVRFTLLSTNGNEKTDIYSIDIR